MTSLPATPASIRHSLAGEDVTRGALGSLAVNVAATAVNFLVALALTNALGASGYGAYAFAFAWATVLTVPAIMGLSPLIVRNVARYHVHSDWGLLRGLLRHSHLAVLASSGAIVVVAGAVGGLLLASDTHLLYPFLAGLLLVPLMSLTTMRQAAMQGLGKVVVGRVPETLVAPGGFLLLALIAWALLDERFSAELALALQAAAAAGAFLLGLWLLRRALPPQIESAGPRYETRAWLLTAIPLMWMSVALAVSAQMATILLGVLDRSSEAGVYFAATRAAMFVSFLFVAAGYAVMPALARLHAEGRRAEVQRLLHRSVRVVFCCSAPVAIGFVVFAPQVLALFGSDFGSGTAVLRILVIGELAKVGTGFAGAALLMMGRERDMTVIAVAGLPLQLTLSLVLIPSLGGDGAAIATSATVIAINVAMVVYAVRRLALSTAILGVRPRPRRP